MSFLFLLLTELFLENKMATPNSNITDDLKCTKNLRGNCSCSAALPPSSKVPEGDSDRLMFHFDDISGNRKATKNEVVSSTSSDQSATPLSSLISQTSSEVFPQDSTCLCLSESVGTQCDSKRSSRSSCKSHAEAISIIVPTCKQRHTNFTPPRNSLSEKTLHMPEETSIFTCSVHNRRSSVCPILCRTVIEASVGRDLRSLSDYFNNKCIGLEDGYHLQRHPQFLYNRVYSSSYPGTLSVSTYCSHSTMGVKGDGAF